MTKKEFWKRMNDQSLVKKFNKGDYSIRVVKVGEDFVIIENGKQIWKTTNREEASRVYADRVRYGEEVSNYLDIPKRNYEGMKLYKQDEAYKKYNIK